MAEELSTAADAARPAFAARTAALQTRVGEAASTLQERGLRPTVARVRAALGGGSPNDLAPALKAWWESWRTARSEDERAGAEGFHHGLPPPIADLTWELWQRALAAALLEVRSGPTARTLAARSEEAQGLRNQLTSARDALEREALAYGELRVQGARHQALARAALLRADEAERRERRALRDLGAARARLEELQASLDQARARLPHVAVALRRPRVAVSQRRAQKTAAPGSRSKSTVRAESRKPRISPGRSKRGRGAQLSPQRRSQARRR